MDSIIRSHRLSTETLRAENARLRLNASNALSELMINTRNNSISSLHPLLSNLSEIQTLNKQLQLNAVQLSKQTKHWSLSITKLQDTLNELGNLEIVGQTMESQLNDIDSAIRNLILLKI
ncbi:hypothetical protein EDI_256130 [Entamoeba dispar SAW760]|uniref:Biogenesis of lysosome-related organelles complex 1 subunit 1 n=1 Tax=Entamoeba dispar (strain ATCC PRA-260 / SAW760) TaxID=370354 RepID=B0END4_ENTDS|nr:uncharacterized protein EDI_256130 [Entamoeba dispar SAW760]EDR23953.1 hypothetical protein EDI_256130 [Entamoeba dispar SAW760]|eukprot:EDR23953.1 hypothetical protein EDI_256130 [Entamoeba dispar SAW760]